MLYTLVAGALLAFVYQKTAPIIEANREAATGGEVLAVVLPGMEGGFEKRGTDTEFPYWVGFADAGKSTPGGYVFTTQGKGYSSTIETIVGVDTDITVTGARVLFQQETPGLGDKILEVRSGEETPWFTDQFVGQSADENIAVVKDGGTIDAITGATISSRAVASSIQNGLANMQAVLSGGEITVVETPPETPAEEPTTPFVLPSDNDLAEVLSGMDGGFTVSGEGTEFPVWTGHRDAAKTEVGGYVFVARGEGFYSTIHTLVATDPDGVITGIKTIFQEETPGWGDRVLEVREGEDAPWFTRQFIGTSADDAVALTADGGTIDAMTGATITSNAVTQSIRTGLANLADALGGKTFPAWPGETMTVSTPAESPGTETATTQTSDQPDETAETTEAAPAPAFQLTPGSMGMTSAEPGAYSVDDSLMLVLPGMEGGFAQQTDGDFSYWIGYRDAAKTSIGGYAFIAKEEGFSSVIETLVGVDPDGTIIGIKTLFQNETPGWGDKILEVREGEDVPWFTRQFIGRSLQDNLTLNRDGGSIDAITGATYSSIAVTSSVSDGLDALMAQVK